MSPSTGYTCTDEGPFASPILSLSLFVLGEFSTTSRLSTDFIEVIHLSCLAVKSLRLAWFDKVYDGVYKLYFLLTNFLPFLYSPMVSTLLFLREKWLVAVLYFEELYILRPGLIAFDLCRSNFPCCSTEKLLNSLTRPDVFLSSILSESQILSSWSLSLRVVMWVSFFSATKVAAR